MTVSRLRSVLTLSVLISALAVTPAFAQQTADVVLEWNRVMNTALAVPGANPGTVFVTRPAALMHIAIFDALNSFDPRYAQSREHGRLYAAWRVRRA